MKQYVQNDVKIKVEMPDPKKESDVKLRTEGQTTTKKEVHILYE